MEKLKSLYLYILIYIHLSLKLNAVQLSILILCEVLKIAPNLIFFLIPSFSILAREQGCFLSHHYIQVHGAGSTKAGFGLICELTISWQTLQDGSTPCPGSTTTQCGALSPGVPPGVKTGWLNLFSFFHLWFNLIRVLIIILVVIVFVSKGWINVGRIIHSPETNLVISVGRIIHSPAPNLVKSGIRGSR